MVRLYLIMCPFQKKIFSCAFSFFSCYLVWFLFCFVLCLYFLCFLIPSFLGEILFFGDFWDFLICLLLFLLIWWFACLFSLFVCLFLCAFFSSCCCYIQRVHLSLYEGREGHFALFHFLSHSFFIISLFSTLLCSFFHSKTCSFYP